MPYPTSSTAISRADITGVLHEYALDQQNFIGRQIFGVIPTAEKAGDFSRLPAAAGTQISTKARAPGGAYPRVDFEIEGDSYECVEYGLTIAVDDSRRTQMASRFDLDVESSMIIANALMLGEEKRVSDLIASSFAVSGDTGVDVTHEWDDKTNAVPIDNIMAARHAIRDKCGVFPDTLVLHPQHVTDLSVCDQIVNRVKSISGEVVKGELGVDFLRQIFQVNRILVPNAMYNSADSGQTESLSDIWPREWAFLAVTNGGSSTLAPRVGGIFAWDADGGVMTAEQYRDEERRSDILRVRQHVDEKIFSTRFGYRIGNLVT